MPQAIARLVKSTTVRIFPPDIIPFPAIATPRSLEKLTDGLGLQPMGTSDAGEVILGGGSVQVDSREVVIESITLGSRRIVTCVLGSSDESEAVAEQFLSLLAGLDPRQPSPLELTDAILNRTESVLVKELELGWEQIFAEQFVRFLTEKVIPSLTDDVATAEIARFNVGFEIKYRRHSDTGPLAQVQLSPKKLALESRSGSSLEDRLYWSSAPIDTARHTELLDELVTACSESGSKQTARKQAGK